MARSRAARRAQSVALEAVSWITPPPGPVERKAAGRARADTSQSSTRVSTSVQAGLVAQSMPWTASPEAASSPKIEGNEAFDGK